VVSERDFLDFGETKGSSPDREASRATLAISASQGFLAGRDLFVVYMRQRV
jgi:hypothetical protein